MNNQTKTTKLDPKLMGIKQSKAPRSAVSRQPPQTKEGESKWLDLGRLERELWSIEGFKQFCLENPHFLLEDYEKICKLTDRVYVLLHMYGFRTPKVNIQHLRKIENDDRGIKYDAVKYYTQKSKFVLSLLRYTAINGAGSWATILKWKACAFFSHYHQQDIPSFPGISEDPFLKAPHIIVPGRRFRNFWNFKWNFDTKRSACWSLLNSILYIKKGSPFINECCVKAQIFKSVQALTSEPVQARDSDIEIFGDCIFKPIGHDWTEHSGMLPAIGLDTVKRVHSINRNTAIMELRRTVHEIFDHNTPLKYKDLIKPIFPSIKANYMMSQEDLGTLGFLKENGFLEAENFKDILGDQPLLIYDLCHSVNVRKAAVSFKGGQRAYDQLGLDIEYQLAFDSSDYSGCSVEQYATTIGADIDFTNMYLCYERLYWNVWPKAIMEIPYVKPVGLGEPFKVRVISKGPPMKYFCLKPIQEYLWSSLKKNSVFSLIGEMVSPDHINKIFVDWNPKGSKIIVSGDYKASTDNLHSWVSQTINDCLMGIIQDRFPKEDLELLPENYFKDLRQMVEDCLTNHIFDNRRKLRDNAKGNTYQPDIKGLGLLLPQKEGQLMGSIISFPFLCIANAALCRWAMEIANNKTYRIIDSKLEEQVSLADLRVNGDDCVFSGDEKYIRYCWEEIGNFLGLSSSIGKTYFSKDFCVINSVLYDFKRYDSDEYPLGYFEERPYINLGLLFGQPKTAFGNEDKQVWHLGAIHRDLMSKCPTLPEIRERVHKQFMHNVRPILEKMEKDGGIVLKYFWPEWLGGVGLDPTFEKRPFSFFDRATAFIQRKLIAYDSSLRPQKGGDFIEWKMHELIKRHYYDKLNWLGECSFKEIQNDEDLWVSMEQESDNIYGKLTLALLFDPKVNFDELHEMTEVDMGQLEDSKETTKEKIKSSLFQKLYMHNLDIYTANAAQISLCHDYVLSERSTKGIKLISLDDMVHDSSKLYLPLCEKTFRTPRIQWGRTTNELPRYEVVQ